MLFIIQQAFSHLFQRKTFCIIMVLSFVLGFFPLSAGIAYGEENIHKQSTYSFKIAGLFTELGVDTSKHQGESFNRSMIDSLLSRNAFVEKYTCVTDVQYKELRSSTSQYFHIIDSYFSDFFKAHQITGRFFESGDFIATPNVCVVEEGYAKNRVGDKVQIGEYNFTIIGVISSSLFRSRVLIPQCDYFNLHTIGFDVVTAGDSSQLSQINWSVLPLIISRNQSTESYAASLSAYAFTLFAQIFIVCLIFFIYMLLNTYNILKNKAQEDVHSFGIRLALGAERKDVFRQFFIEVLLLMLPANIVLIATDSFASPYISLIFEHRFGPITIASLFVCCILSAFILTKIALRKALRQQTVNLIEERSV